MSDKKQDLKLKSTDQLTIDINPVEIIELFRKKRIWIIGAMAVTMILTATVMMLAPNRYTSHASILPSGNSSNISGLMGFVSGFDLGAQGSADENSSALYPSILNSDLVRDGVLEQAYKISSDNSPKTIRLNDYFNLNDSNKLRAALSNHTAISTDKKLGIVRIRVETTDRYLSQAILQGYLEQLEDYLNNKRKSRASDNQAYLAIQLKTRSKELRRSENELQEFMELNRNWASSTDPELNLTLGRLKREVELANQTNILLTQQLELARLEAQKDIPIVRLLDAPSLPTTKSGPSRTINTIFSGMTALLLVSIGILLISFWKQLMGDVSKVKLSDAKSDSQPANRVRGLVNLKRAREKNQTPVS